MREQLEEKIFTDEFLEEIGFIREDGHGSPQYGRAREIASQGRTTIQWNNEGVSCTYTGIPLKSNVAVGIKKDWDTRTVFNGYIYTRGDIERILSLTL